jgi:hypothetical protein
VKALVEKILGSVRRDRELPASALLVKGARYVSAFVSAPLFLAGCTRVGARPRTIGRPRIANEGTIELGSDVILNSSFVPVDLSAGPGATLAIGDRAAMAVP